MCFHVVLAFTVPAFSFLVNSFCCFSDKRTTLTTQRNVTTPRLCCLFLFLMGNSLTTNVATTSEYIFDRSSGLTSVTIPSGVTSIGNWTFDGCSGLTSITIPSGVTSIGNGAFSECSGLTSVTIPSSVTSIGNCAFSGCRGLTSVTIQSGVTSIGESAFSGCRGLTSVNYSGNTEPKFKNNPFYECDKLSYIIVPNDYTSHEFCGKPVVIDSCVVQKVSGSENQYVDEKGRIYELKDDVMILVQGDRIKAPMNVRIREQQEDITQEVERRVKQYIEKTGINEPSEIEEAKTKITEEVKAENASMPMIEYKCMF